MTWITFPPGRNRMPSRLSRALVSAVAAAVLVLAASPAVADSTIPTTPIPEPVSPGQPPVSAPEGPQPLGRAVADAAASLGILRLLPNAVPTSSMLPGYGDQLPKQAVLEAGLGLSSAQANSEAYLSWERAVAQSAPAGMAVGGNAPQPPGGLVQTALPDNPTPITGGFSAPPHPLGTAGLLTGSVHARWSPTLGPCVDTIADAGTSMAGLSLLGSVPTLPDLPLDRLPNLPQLAGGFDRSKGLQTFGGLLAGSGQPRADGTGALLSLPGTLSTHSVTKLVDIPNSPRKAIQSVSTMQVAEIDLLKGTPLALTLKVLSQPTLRITSTGDKATSKVEYSAPVVTIERQGQVLYTLDAAHPTEDIPIGLPLKALSDKLGTGVQSLPVVGGLVATATKGPRQLSVTNGLVLDIGVLRLSIAQLNQKEQQLTVPFDGYQLGASARLLDLQVLPTAALKAALPNDAADSLPSSLAQVSLGEQIGRAYAPPGGVTCGSTSPAAASPGESEDTPRQLAYTSGAYSAVPMFWTGSAMLLLGVILVAAFPSRRRTGAAAKPSPRRRSHRFSRGGGR
jgi:hypothetical protein